MRNDKKMAIMATAIMVISVFAFAFAFAFVMPASAIAVECVDPCTNVSACNLTELLYLGTVNLSDCWDNYTGTENFELMIIDDKNRTTWDAIDGCPYGLVGYYNYTEENTLKGVVEVWGLNATKNYQLSLNGYGGTYADEVFSTICDYPAQGINVTESPWNCTGCPEAWVCNNWTDPVSSVTQGFMNFEMCKETDTCGHFCYEFNITLPAGTYEKVKFLVKEAEPPWTPDITNPYGWTTILMDCEWMNFTIKCNSCTNVDACNLTQLLEAIDLGACWDNYTGTENFELMMIDDKNRTTWDAIDGCPYGLVGYYNNSEELKGVVEVWGLDTTKNYQLSLNGYGGTYTDEVFSTICDYPAQNVNVTESPWNCSGCPNAWVCNNWTDPYGVTQGFMNFEMCELTDACGHFCYEFNIALPSGTYENVKFLVKEAEPPWTPDSTNPYGWTTILMDCEPMNFTISPSGNAADDTLVIKDVYTIMEPVYAIGHNFPPNKYVDIYIVTPVRTWTDGDIIADYAIIGPVNATTDANGSIGIDPTVLMWEYPDPGEYQLVFDDPNGVFDQGFDIADFFEVIGIAAPVLSPIGIVALVGLLSIIATSTLVRRKKRQ
jgi:hypothetical protein